MADALVEYLRRDLDCENLLDCIHGLKDIDRRSFRVLAKSREPLTVDEVAGLVDRERSTAYRSVQRLLKAGLIQKEQINYEQGSYYHVYTPTDPDEIADDMQRTLNDWYAEMGQLIQEFRDKYGRVADRRIEAEG